ncbi:unnamed protein product [Pedinophyceae sp. YPF-701]|nr:unnamed protein product [Pedinophyceae sp. YPF-701]
MGLGGAPRVAFGPQLPPDALEDTAVEKEVPFNGDLHGELAGHKGAVLTVRYNAQGAYCITGGRDRSIVLWNPAKGLRIKTYEAHGQEVRSVDCSHDNARLASCGLDRQIFYWDVATARTIRRFEGHGHAANACRLAAEGYLIVSGGEDKAVKIWDARAHGFRPVQHMEAFRDSVTSVAAPASRPEIVAGSVDGTLRRFDVRGGRVVTDETAAPIVSVAVSQDGECTLLAGTDSTLRLLDRATGSLLQHYKGHRNDATRMDCALSPSDAHVVCGSEDGRVLVWDLVTAREMMAVQAHEGGVTALCVHPTGEGMLTAGADGKVRVWT